MEKNEKIGNDRVLYQVYETTDYSKFKDITGNREKNEGHLKALENAIENDNLLQVSHLIVNEKFEVIDGQHRLEAAKRLGLPVAYAFYNGLTLEHVQDLNKNNRTWKYGDKMHSFCSQGKKHYVQLSDFIDKYGFGQWESQLMLGGKWASYRKVFQNGLFEVQDYEKACRIAEQILSFEHYFSRFRLRSFVLAMVEIMWNPNYDHNRMIRKLQLGKRIELRVDKKEYIRHIEEIYNYRESHNRVYFSH